MNTTVTLLRQLEAHVQEELGAQARLLALLETQERALRANVGDDVLAATQALDIEIEASARRGRRRDELLAGLAEAWGVAARTLTLSSVVRRAGEEGERLARQKLELERLASRTTRLARRNAMAARFHERLTQDVVRALLALKGDARVEDGGQLVDAEA